MATQTHVMNTMVQAAPAKTTQRPPPASAALRVTAKTATGNRLDQGFQFAHCWLSTRIVFPSFSLNGLCLDSVFFFIPSVCKVQGFFQWHTSEWASVLPSVQRGHRVLLWPHIADQLLSRSHHSQPAQRAHCVLRCPAKVHQCGHSGHYWCHFWWSRGVCVQLSRHFHRGCGSVHGNSHHQDWGGICNSGENCWDRKGFASVPYKGVCQHLIQPCRSCALPQPTAIASKASRGGKRN